MFEYLKIKDGPVIEGLESKEVIYAKDQPEYLPLRTLVSKGPERRVISRWTLTEDQRKAVAEGADIFLLLLTYGQPLQPIQMATGTGKEDTGWVEVCWLDSPVSEKIKYVLNMPQISDKDRRQFNGPKARTVINAN